MMPEPRQLTPDDTGTQGSVLDWYSVLEWLLVDMRSANTIAAMLQAAKDAMEQERRCHICGGHHRMVKWSPFPWVPAGDGLYFCPYDADGRAKVEA